MGIDLPQRVAGFLVQKELAFFAPILEGPDRIDVAILGGAKVTDKIQLIRHLLRRVRHLVVGGAMPFTFLSVLYGMKVQINNRHVLLHGRSCMDGWIRLVIACLMKRAPPSSRI